MRATSRRSTGPACARHSERVRSAGSILTTNTAWCGTRQRRWSEARGLDSYDQASQLTSVNDHSGSPITYTYAADGLRATKTKNTQTTNYTWDRSTEAGW